MKIIIAEYREEKVKNYQAVIESLNLDYKITTDLSIAEKADALLLPGGADVNPERYGQKPDPTVTVVDDKLDREQLALIDLFVKAKKPILGICRGCQLLNVYFGGTLIQDLKTNIAHHSTGFSGDSYHLADCDGFLEELYGKQCQINSSHHQAIGRLGKDLTVISTAPDGTVEGIVHNFLPVIAVQWHPERTTLKFAKEGVVDGIEVFNYFLDKYFKK